MKPLTIVIFGITSNLAQIKLIPALYAIARQGLLPNSVKIIGVSRQKLSRGEYLSFIENTLFGSHVHTKLPKKADYFLAFSKQLHIFQGDVTDPEFYVKLKAKLHRDSGHSSDVLFYFATFPELYQYILEQLHHSGLNRSKNSNTKIVIEKPLGVDLASAQSLNRLILQHFTEEQIYRVDHYLGKETVQNILSFRFANGLFEPLMNSEHIDHIQITSAESLGVSGRSYYDSVGALRDVGQNHLLQMLAFITMDTPKELTNDAVTQKRIEILKSLNSNRTEVVFGQYQSYQYESDTTKDSKTDTLRHF